jgi:PAS domain S-box-containing protein
MSALSSPERFDGMESGPEQRQNQVRYFLLGLLLLVASAAIWPMLGHNLAGVQFMPHTFCYLGNTTLIGTHMISDLLIGLSYVVISLTLVYLVRSSKGGIPFHWMFLAFGTFIIACGATHFMEVLTLWQPAYWASAYVKVVTAVASVATAFALPLAIPPILRNVQAVGLSETRSLELARTNQDLSTANEKLQELDRLRRRFVAQAAANIGDWEWEITTRNLHWSEEVETMHGFAPRTFNGKYEYWLASIHPDDRERTTGALRSALDTHGDYDVEYRTIRADGSVYWIAARAAVECDAAGKPIRMVGMCMDITRRKQTEDTLRKTEKLAAAGRLAATIAHEVNNPLEAVTNLIFLARNEEKYPERYRLLEMADKELQRVSHITRQTLGFYRDSGRSVRVDLNDIVKNVLDVFQGKLKAKGVQVRFESEGETIIYGAPGELTQVVSNLISNAVDASPAGSTVRVRVRRRRANAVLVVSDQGDGIPVGVRPMVFEPFFTTKKDVGTGLGLWISRRIVQNHGGSIRFRSSNGTGRSHPSGTVFVVNLRSAPMAKEAAG